MIYRVVLGLLVLAIYWAALRSRRARRIAADGHDDRAVHQAAGHRGQLVGR